MVATRQPRSDSDNLLDKHCEIFGCRGWLTADAGRSVPTSEGKYTTRGQDKTTAVSYLRNAFRLFSHEKARQPYYSSAFVRSLCTTQKLNIRPRGRKQYRYRYRYRYRHTRPPTQGRQLTCSRSTGGRGPGRTPLATATARPPKNGSRCSPRIWRTPPAHSSPRRPIRAPS